MWRVFLVISQKSNFHIGNPRLGDPDYLGHLGHFFGESVGSHPQTTLSGSDSDF